MLTGPNTPSAATDPDGPAIRAPGPPDPRRRPAEPEHPMSLEGGVIDGDTALMLRILAEELLMTGLRPADVIAMSCDPCYQALHAARRTLGGATADAIVVAAAARCGVHRHRMTELGADFRPAPLTISASRGVRTQGG